MSLKQTVDVPEGWRAQDEETETLGAKAHDQRAPVVPRPARLGNGPPTVAPSPAGPIRMGSSKVHQPRLVTSYSPANSAGRPGSVCGCQVVFSAPLGHKRRGSRTTARSHEDGAFLESVIHADYG